MKNNSPKAKNIMPIFGLGDFSASADEYDIGNDISLVRNPQIIFADHIENSIHKPVLGQLKAGGWALMHTYTCDPKIHIGPKEDESDARLRLAFLAMWITRPTGAHFSYFIKYHPSFSNDVAHTINKYYAEIIPHPSYSATLFDEDQILDLQTIFTNLLGYFGKEKRPSLAIDFVSTALQINPWGPRYVTFTSVLECLFSTDPMEVTHKLSERVALFLEQSPEERQNIFKEIKKLYGLRSTIVHGGNLSRNLSAENHKMGGELEQIAHRVLKRLFKDLDLLERLSKKRPQVQKYFENLLFY